MEGTENEHIVDFEKYCAKCVSKEKPESDDPCWDCLAEGVALNGVPTYFKKNDHEDAKGGK